MPTVFRGSASEDRGRVLHVAWRCAVGGPGLEVSTSRPDPERRHHPHPAVEPMEEKPPHPGARRRGPDGTPRPRRRSGKRRHGDAGTILGPSAARARRRGQKYAFRADSTSFTPTFAASMYTLCLPWTTCAGTYICHNPGPRTPVPRGPSAVGGGTRRTALGSWRASRGRRNNPLNQYVRSPPPAPCVLSGGTPYQRHGCHVVEPFGDGFSRHVPARRRARRGSIFAPAR